MKNLASSSMLIFALLAAVLQAVESHEVSRRLRKGVPVPLIVIAIVVAIFILYITFLVLRVLLLACAAAVKHCCRSAREAAKKTRAAHQQRKDARTPRGTPKRTAPAPAKNDPKAHQLDLNKDTCGIPEPEATDNALPEEFQA